MQKKMLFIFNPRAGKGQMKNRLLDILNIFTAAGYDVTVRPTQERGDAQETARRLGPACDLIVCSGGDGTLDEVVTGMMQVDCQVTLGYIPAGSTNDFGSSLDIPKNMIQAAGNIVRGHPIGCDVGAFNDDTFVYVAAFGLFTDVAYSTNQDLKNVLGHLAYILEGVKKLYSIPSYSLRVTNNTQSFEAEYIFGMITNSRSVGGFKNMTGKNVELDDGLFEATLIRKPQNLLDLQEIVGSLMTEVDNTDLIDSFKASEIKIEAGREIPWTLDGEFGGDHRIADIRNLKQAMRIMLPTAEAVKS